MVLQKSHTLPTLPRNEMVRPLQECSDLYVLWAAKFAWRLFTIRQINFQPGRQMACLVFEQIIRSMLCNYI